MSGAAVRWPCGWLPRAVLFDLDGVLVDSMRFHVQAWQSAVRSVLNGRVAAQEIYRREGEPGRVTARDVLIAHGRRPTATAMAALLEEKERCFMACRWRIRPYRCARRLLAVAQCSGLPLGLVTGTSQPEVRRMVPAWMRAVFRVLVTGDRVRRGKPHPEPYRTACRWLRVDPERTLVVENAPYGIASAQSAGIGCVVGVATSLPRTALRDADVTVPSLEVLCELLEQRLRYPDTVMRPINRRRKTCGMRRTARKGRGRSQEASS